MRTYEIRSLDQWGRLKHARDMACEDDDTALERLARVRHPGPLELWEGERLVWSFERSLVRERPKAAPPGQS